MSIKRNYLSWWPSCITNWENWNNISFPWPEKLQIKFDSNWRSGFEKEEPNRGQTLIQTLIQTFKFVSPARMHILPGGQDLKACTRSNLKFKQTLERCWPYSVCQKSAINSGKEILSCWTRAIYCGGYLDQRIDTFWTWFSLMTH